ncbi:MAG: glycosyltransferase family 4 protein [Rhodospirillales bacterium]|nr:MAG: glycosyltransferase family 4 protein [Rhodospirillales bacterium]
MPPPASDSVLIMTLPPVLGGVTSMGPMVAGLLRRHGHVPTMAWRAYYEESRHLSVPIWRTLMHGPSTEEVDGMEFRRVRVGTRLPEMEWAHHQPWPPWRELVESHARHVVISGNPLTAWAPVKLGLPTLQWLASPYAPDRVDRVARWPAWRRVYDAALNAWICARQERRILEHGEVLSISQYTQDALAAVTPRARLRGVLPIPVDAERFTPAGRPSPAGRKLRVGFNGRISDPRKNMALLVKAFERAARTHPDIELHLRGNMARADFIAANDAGAIADRLVIGPPVPVDDMPDWYRSLDVYVIASHQEGLSIVGTEAMACGTPVLSTRCGGPEDFTIDGETGLLCGFAVEDMADRLVALVGDAALRARLADGGVTLIRDRYSHAAFERGFMDAFAAVFR